MMTKEEKISYWVELSDYDLETAEAMFETKRYLYVAFMCHQVIEKIFKACYSKLKEETPPFVHDLTLIVERAGFFEMLDNEQIEFIEQISPLNIRARYPDYKKELVQKLTKTVCEDLMSKTKELQQWTKEKILLIN
jgi:HEPN domain-containing protein